MPTATTQREAEHARVDADVGDARDVGRLQRGERPDPGKGDGDADGARRNREHERFGEELSRQPAAVRADRQPQRQLALARRGARQVQVRDVEAGDREEQDRGAEEQQQDRTRRRRERLTQRHGRGVEHPRAVAVTLLQRPREGADLALGRADGDPARHARDDREVVGGPRRLRRIELASRPEIAAGRGSRSPAA